MRKPVRVLNEGTINQIAAGEVIENPASCVKELVENAIDAGAGEITVETKAGGKAFIRVADDGMGMRGDDLLLAVERHATSKIFAIDDLFSLHTLGFRGEAIASIASVSKLTITTSPEEGGSGSKLYTEGGKIIKVEEASRPHGTTVLVSSLFFNVPVRKKFLKSVAQESASIHKILIWAALAHPEIVFRWIHDGRQEFLTPQSDRGVTVSHLEILLGRDMAEGLVPFSFEEGLFKMEGFLGKASAHRPNRLGQYLFINGRPIFSFFISGVINEGYGTALPTGRHPQFVLKIEIPRDWVDVNVHPQKKEVRFVNKSNLRVLLLRSLETRLREEPVILYNYPRVPFTPSTKRVVNPPQMSIDMPSLPIEPQIKLEVAAIIGHFVLVKREKDLFLINAKRGIIKLREEKMLKSYEGKEQAPSQTLLLPHTFECRSPIYRTLVEVLPLLEKLGIGMSILSGSTLIINSLPPHVSTEKIEDLLEEVAQEVKMAKTKTEEIAPIMIKKVSSSFSKTSLNKEVGFHLATTLLECKNPIYTLGGERIMRKITEKELEQWLG